MNLVTFFVLLLNLFSITAMTEDRPGKVSINPPSIYSRRTIQKWVDQELKQVNPRLETRLLETQAWADYVNFHHFVSLTFEDVPQGFIFDYNWPAKMDKQTRSEKVQLPLAEVTEEGRFIYWWDQCNFYEFTEQECRDFIHMAVTHENRHYQQWLSLASEASRNVHSSEHPKNLDELRKVSGAEKIFMKTWGDGLHYQCREVEVYTTQLSNGEMSPTTPGGLENLLKYYKGCVNSKYAPHFRPFLVRALELFQKYKPLSSRD